MGEGRGEEGDGRFSIVGVVGGTPLAGRRRSEWSRCSVVEVKGWSSLTRAQGSSIGPKGTKSERPATIGTAPM